MLHFNFPQETVDQLKKFKPELKYIPYINRLVPLSPCKEWLKAGDMVFSLDNQIIADNLYMFDRFACTWLGLTKFSLVDLKVNKTVDIVVYRNGIRLAQSIQVVDVEKTKIKKFALFAGGTLHCITIITSQVCSMILHHYYVLNTRYTLEALSFHKLSREAASQIWAAVLNPSPNPMPL